MADPVTSLFLDFYAQTRMLLIEARKSAGITQIELAKILKRPQSFVAKYENGERRLDVAEYITIARILGSDPYAVLKRAESENCIVVNSDGDQKA